jgi:hypothetical protein
MLWAADTTTLFLPQEPAGTKSAGSRKRAAAAAPEAADAPAAAAAATVDGPAGRAKRRKQQVPASTMGTGCVRQQTSPVRRSGRQTAAAADDVDGPAASGAAAVSGAGEEPCSSLHRCDSLCCLHSWRNRVGPALKLAWIYLSVFNVVACTQSC